MMRSVDPSSIASRRTLLDMTLMLIPRVCPTRTIASHADAVSVAVQGSVFTRYNQCHITSVARVDWRQWLLAATLNAALWACDTSKKR